MHRPVTPLTECDSLPDELISPPEPHFPRSGYVVSFRYPLVKGGAERKCQHLSKNAPTVRFWNPDAEQPAFAALFVSDLFTFIAEPATGAAPGS